MASPDPAMLHIDQVIPVVSQGAETDAFDSKAAIFVEPESHNDTGVSPNAVHCKSGRDWLEGCRDNKKGGLVLLDQEVIRKQQGVFKEVLLQLGSQLLSGKLSVHISLPIRIFEPRSLLERIADSWAYAPTFLARAALATNPVERMQHAMAFVVAGVHFCIGPCKPFNPILGETYQATFADGTEVYLEHVAHQPVQTAFTLEDARQRYQLHGIFQFESVTSGNSICNHQLGTVTMRFHDGGVITYTMPQIKISGMMLGERVIDLTGVSTFEDKQHQLTGKLQFGANTGFLSRSQADDIKGQILQSSSTGSSKPRAISLAAGSWLSALRFDGKSFWDIDQDTALAHQPVDAPLPSDSRFREDLVMLARGDLARAQQEKLRLEELQRNDHKLRAKGKRSH